jgi:hypothetical protein
VLPRGGIKDRSGEYVVFNLARLHLFRSHRRHLVRHAHCDDCSFGVMNRLNYTDEIMPGHWTASLEDAYMLKPQTALASWRIHWYRQIWTNIDAEDPATPCTMFDILAQTSPSSSVWDELGWVGQDGHMRKSRPRSSLVITLFFS